MRKDARNVITFVRLAFFPVMYWKKNQRIIQKNKWKKFFDRIMQIKRRFLTKSIFVTKFFSVIDFRFEISRAFKDRA